MSEDWTAIAAEVDEALASIQDGTLPTKGQGKIIRAGATTGPDYDPEPGTPTEHPCNVLFDVFMSDEIDGTLILATDLKIIVGADQLDIDPTPSDKFQDGDVKDYAIINVTPLKPAGVVVMWELQCRG